MLDMRRMYQNRRVVVNSLVAVTLYLGLIVSAYLASYLAYLGGEWLWGRMSNYVLPETPTERKDLLNVFVLIAAGVVGFLTALAAMLNVYMSRRNLHQQRNLDERRAQDEALQAYYEQIGALLTEHNLRELGDSDDPVRWLAQSQTKTVLRRVDETRKSDLTRFLSEAGLITGRNPVVLLGRVNLKNVDLSGAYLVGAYVSKAYLPEATLSRATLSRADLSGADLSGADLSRADLSGADLSGADLSGANLSRAENLTQEQLEQASGDEYTKLPEGLERPKSWSQG